MKMYRLREEQVEKFLRISTRAALAEKFDMSEPMLSMVLSHRRHPGPKCREIIIRKMRLSFRTLFESCCKEGPKPWEAEK